MLSVGKLSYLAQLHEDDTVIEQSVLDSKSSGELVVVALLLIIPFSVP